MTLRTASQFESAISFACRSERLFEPKRPCRFLCSSLASSWQGRKSQDRREPREPHYISTRESLVDLVLSVCSCCSSGVTAVEKSRTLSTAAAASGLCHPFPLNSAR